MGDKERLTGASRYFQAVYGILDEIVSTQTEAIDAAAAAVVETIVADGLVYLFGTGHSHMMAEEGHYRAGGLGAVCPILSSSLMLHESAGASTAVERTSGIAAAILSRYALTPADTLIIFSNSGVNTVPVEMALAAKSIGTTIVAVVSLDYARTTPAKVDGQKLHEIADVVIDNRGVPGDALVELDESGLRTGSSSTVTGTFILNAVLTEAIWRLSESGQPPPIYISANLPGALAHNAELVAHFRPRNPHL